MQTKICKDVVVSHNTFRQKLIASKVSLSLIKQLLTVATVNLAIKLSYKPPTNCYKIENAHDDNRADQ